MVDATVNRSRLPFARPLVAPPRLPGVCVTGRDSYTIMGLFVHANNIRPVGWRRFLLPAHGRFHFDAILRISLDQTTDANLQ